MYSGLFPPGDRKGRPYARTSYSFAIFYSSILPPWARKRPVKVSLCALSV